MDISKQARIRDLAELVGISISEEELPEVVNRFESLMLETERLQELDLSNIQPVTVFPEEVE
ncbi:MAG: hypothetical protein V3S37_07285 [Dehalococcoidia bacterium]